MTNDTKNLINIAFSCNDSWVDKLAVTLTSTLKHADTNDNYCFYVLDGGISNQNKNKLSKIQSKVPFKIKYIPVNKELFSNAPLGHHFTVETYYRLKIPSLINVDKLLYMDVDTIVRKNILKLFKINITNFYAGVVVDENSSFKIIHKLPVKNYFNAGVMLLNLKKIRDDHLEEKFFDFINNYSDLISWVDQCVLNACFNENVLFINKIYNFQHNTNIPNLSKEYKRIKKDIVILHFVSGKKPWNFQKSFDFIFEYYFYLMQTPFRWNILKDIEKCSLFRKLNKTFLIFKF